MPEIKTYMTPGQSQALYARFLDQIKEEEDTHKLINLAVTVIPILLLIVINVIVEGVEFRLISSLMLISSTMMTHAKNVYDPRDAIVAAIKDLERYEEYEVYVRAIADPSEQGQLIARTLMEPDEEIYGDKPSAKIRVAITCDGYHNGAPCNHTFAVIVSCPAWGCDSWEIECPKCGHDNEFMVDGSMVDERPEIKRLEAAGVPAAPVALIADTSTKRLDESMHRVTVLR